MADKTYLHIRVHILLFLWLNHAITAHDISLNALDSACDPEDANLETMKHMYGIAGKSYKWKKKNHFQYIIPVIQLDRKPIL